MTKNIFPRLSRVFTFMIKAYLKIHFGKWKGIVVAWRAKLMALWDALSQYSHRIKREAFKRWISKSGFLLSVKRSIDRYGSILCIIMSGILIFSFSLYFNRLYRQVQHGLYKNISRCFHKWVRATNSVKKRSVARGMEEQLDYMLLKSQVEQLRNGESLAAKLIAEKAINRLEHVQFA